VPIELDDASARDARSWRQGQTKKDLPTMNRNVLYLIIGALAVAAAVVSYQFYQERQKTAGIEINVGKSGVSIEKK
jgi:cell division protein FtsL